MDVNRLTATVGVLAALGVAGAVGAPPAAVAAAVFGSLAAVLVGTTVPDRDVAERAVASLALATAALLVARGVSTAASTTDAVAVVAVAGGVAGALAVAAGPSEGRFDSLLGAWLALALVPVGVAAVLAVGAQPLRSLVGARLVTVGPPLVTLGLPVAVGLVAAYLALDGWRDAGLPPWALAVGPAAALVVGSIAHPSGPPVGPLLAGGPVEAPGGYVLLWATAALLVASSVAAAVAVDDPRYRRGPAWLATACGPAALCLVVGLDGGGAFVGAALAAVPAVTPAYGAVAETSPPSTASFLLGFAGVVALAAVAVLPARVPGLRTLTAGRPAGVSLGCLLVAVAVSELAVAATALAGGLAVLSWVLLAGDRWAGPPPRTALEHAGTATLAIAGGAVLAVVLVAVVPQTDPGVGPVLLLAGVAVLGLSIR